MMRRLQVDLFLLMVDHLPPVKKASCETKGEQRQGMNDRRPERQVLHHTSPSARRTLSNLRFNYDNISHIRQEGSLNGCERMEPSGVGGEAVNRPQIYLKMRKLHRRESQRSLFLYRLTSSKQGTSGSAARRVSARSL